MDELADNAVADNSTGASVSVESQAPATEQTNNFTIPDAYKDKGWAKNIKSYDDLFKSYDGSQALIGKKEVIKQPQWDDENSRNEFVKAMRPEREDAYDIPDEHFAPEEKKFYQKLMYDNGISKPQADVIFKELTKLRADAYSADGMTNALKQSWGDKVSEKTNATMAALKQYASQEDLAVFDKLPNTALAPLYRTINSILEKHGIVDTGAAVSKASGNKVDVSSQRNDILNEIMAENNKPNRDWKKLEDLKAKLNATYKG